MKGSYLFTAFILCAFLSVGLRLAEIVFHFQNPDVFTARMAQAAGGGAKKEEAKAPVDVPEGLPEDQAAPLPQNSWADPETLDIEFSETQTVALKELKERREALDDREDRMNQREALLQVTERRIEEKIAELEELRVEIETLLGNQSEEEEARLQSLVKIYSGMKPKDAALIFNNLDMDILLQVVSRMSERKTAPIMAAMNTDIAQKLTTLLAEQKKLPDFAGE